MKPFEPIGERARWRVIYDLLRKKNVGDSLTYDEISEAIDLHPQNDRHAMQMATRRAAKELEQVDERALEPIANVGYRVVEPREHLRLARLQQKKSQRALESGHSKVTHVDLSGMDVETRRAFEVVAIAFSMQMEMTRRLDVGQKRLEAAVASVVERTERSEEELAELRERLERLESQQSADDESE